MFRRSTKSPAEQSAEDLAPKPGGKGRPTPTRKEAEAAARARARGTMDKATARKVLRERRTEQNAKVRQGLRAGDERYLPARDQGPVKRFVRDFIDGRICFGEFLLPLLVVLMVMQYLAPSIFEAIWTATILLTVLDTLWMLWRLKRALRQRFPEASQRGVTFYAIMRMLQLRWMRMPKRKVKLGEQPR